MRPSAVITAIILSQLTLLVLFIAYAGLHIGDGWMILSAAFVATIVALAGALSLHDLLLKKLAALEDNVSRLRLQSDFREQAIVDNANEIICSLNGDYLFLAINSASSRLWGCDSRTLAGKSFLDFTLQPDRDRTREALEKVRRERSPVKLENRICVSKDLIIDQAWEIEWSARDDKFFLVGEDITARKEIERLKQQFVSMISHDLKTPLSSLKVTLALLADGNCGSLTDEGIELVEGSQRSVSRLIELIEDLLEIEKLESGTAKLNCSKVATASLFARSVESVQSLATAKRIVLEIRGDGTTVYGDEERLVQVLVNLLSNAIKFSPEGTTVVLDTELDHERVIVNVHDDGEGVPLEDQARIFDRFEQVRLSDSIKHRGTGLGLAICKSIVEQHGGTIGVRSRERRGSTFWFNLKSAGDSLNEEGGNGVLKSG